MAAKIVYPSKPIETMKKNSPALTGYSAERALLEHPMNDQTKLSPAKKPRKSNKTKKTPEKAVCVYCGSGHGTNPIYADAARTLGTDLANASLRLIYGGGGMGLMGEVARATIAGGGKVTGIIPDFLSEREHMLHDVDKLIVTGDMHERKRLMFENSSAFVALPGGVGTLEELVEQLTWSQLGQHKKPIILANIAGFWDPFLELLGHMRDQAFIRAGLEVSFTVVPHAEDIVPGILEAWKTSGKPLPDAATLAKF